MKICAINAPYFGEEKKRCLRDLALVTGATLIGTETGTKLETTTLNQLGSSTSIDIQKGFSTIIGGVGDLKEVEKRISFLQDELQQTQDMQECEKIQERISRLVGGIAIIKVGGATEIEITEKRFRIDDALQAVKAAQEEGVVIGGGCTFLQIADRLKEVIYKEQEQDQNLPEDQLFGFKIIERALRVPFCKLLTNAGLVPEVYIKELQEHQAKMGPGDNTVFNLWKKEFVDAFEVGVIDPAKVLRCALQNAVSAAIALLTSNYSIVER
jgi:chaperonin GroEL